MLAALTDALRRRRAPIEERIGPGSPWWGEHTARYDYAVPFIEGRVVLDVACGTGYGTAALSRRAKWAVGVDVDPVAIAAARAAIDPTRAEILECDATHLPHADGHFGAITSFETIEHLPDRPAFLRELARVLAKDGTLLLSTPNARYTRPIDGKPQNPFHLHEYLPGELREELSAFFSDVTLIGQTLDSRYVVPPFWWDAQIVDDPVLKAGFQVRRVAHRLPGRARDAVAQVLWGHDYYPAASDYHFEAERFEDAPILVALCRNPLCPSSLPSSPTTTTRVTFASRSTARSGRPTATSRWSWSTTGRPTTRTRSSTRTAIASAGSARRTRAFRRRETGESPRHAASSSPCSTPTTCGARTRSKSSWPSWPRPTWAWCIASRA